MKKVLALVLTLVLALSVVGTAMAAKIGVAMPTQSLPRWNLDGANLVTLLEADGHEVDLQYANNEITTQASQIENMITNGAELLVIASVDGSALGPQLASAKELGIPIIAYDRMLTYTTDVDYYVSYDNFSVGVIQGTYLKDRFDLDNATGPFNMEIFAGDPADLNATYFYNGAMSIMQPYIDSGVVVVPSGQTTFEQVATARWDSKNAQDRMDNLIVANYSGDTKLDMILCSNDTTALGATNSLLAAGFDLDNFPVITGQDCDLPNTINVIAGYQAMSVWKDFLAQGLATKGLIDAILAGETPETNEVMPNFVLEEVPSIILTPVLVDSDNYATYLVDSGYYSLAELGLE